MHAALVESFDRPPRYAEVDEPAVGEPGLVRLEVVAAALHPRVRSGANGSHYTSDGQLPLVPGVDGVGRQGDGSLVWFIADDTAMGTMAEIAVVDRRRTVALPAGLDPIVAAAAMNPAMSSWVALRRRIELIMKGEKRPPRVPGEELRPGNPLSLRYDSCRAQWHGLPLDLTLTEFNIIAYMVENRSRDVSYREIYDIVHGEGFVAGEGDIGFRTNVRAFIKRIRQKFRDVDPGFAGVAGDAGGAHDRPPLASPAAHAILTVRQSALGKAHDRWPAR